MFVLLQNMPDPEVESANGASKETIQKLTTRRENLQVVLQELSVRIHERQMATTEAEISLKRKLERAEENRRRKSAERASAEQVSVDRNEVKIFTGKSHTLREARLKDRDGAADAATFYGTGGVTSGAKSRHQKTEVDLTLQDSEAAREMKRSLSGGAKGKTLASGSRTSRAVLFPRGDAPVKGSLSNLTASLRPLSPCPRTLQPPAR